MCFSYITRGYTVIELRRMAALPIDQPLQAILVSGEFVSSVNFHLQVMSEAMPEPGQELTISLVERFRSFEKVLEPEGY